MQLWTVAFLSTLTSPFPVVTEKQAAAEGRLDLVEWAEGPTCDLTLER